MNASEPATPVRTAVEIAVNLLLLFVLVAWCLQIVLPFVHIVTWGVIIAVSAYFPFLRLRAALGGSGKLAVTIFALAALLVIILPAWMFTGSLVNSAQSWGGNLLAGDFRIPPPSESVRQWPLIGEWLYASWSDLAANLGGWLSAHSDLLKPVATRALGVAAGLGLAVVQFVLAVLVAAAMLAHEAASKAALRRFFHRLVGDQADAMLQLAAATVRSVTVGVLGIALIQAIAGGAGMMLVGVPASGVWALIILVLAIAQLPPMLVLLPAILYVFAVESTTVAVLFAIWSVAVAFSDAVLKPLLLGRGVEAPMPVILLGAIGGMLLSGIIGLFSGAVVLALGYKLFQAWLGGAEQPAPQQPA